MAVRDFGEEPMGLREAVVTETSGGAHALVAERLFVFRPVFDVAMLEGEDVTISVGSRVVHFEWELEEGGIPLPLYAALIGGTLSATAATDYYLRRLDTDAVPWIQIAGRAISEDSGDFEVVFTRCKVTGGVEGRLEKGQFTVTACSGLAVRHPTTKLFFTYRQKSVAAAIS